MQLAVKLYHEKLPRIGIIYSTEFQAGKAYEPFLSKYAGDKFKMTIELQRGKANLTLDSINGSAKVVYKDLEYKIEHLKKLQTYASTAGELELVHTYWKGNTLTIAKVHFKNPKPILIHGYELVAPVGYSA
jgi:hypothetical protein